MYIFPRVKNFRERHMTIIDVAITEQFSVTGDLIESGDSNRKFAMMVIERIMAGSRTHSSSPDTQPVAIAA